MINEYGYDPIKLISAIEMHPNLWDRKCKKYKIKATKQVSWKEVYRTVIENFNDLPTKDQQSVGLTLQGKWNNIRDAFIRSVKRAEKRGKINKYVYNSQLQFLLKNREIKKDELVNSDDEEMCLPDHITLANIKRETPDDPLVLENVDYIEANSEVNMHVQVPCRIESQDEAFFSSILPTISKYTEGEKLEFRMDVLTAMKKIRDKRK